MPDSFTSILSLFLIISLGITLSPSSIISKSEKLETASLVTSISAPIFLIQGYIMLGFSDKDDAIKTLCASLLLI